MSSKLLPSDLADGFRPIEWMPMVDPAVSGVVESSPDPPRDSAGDTVRRLESLLASQQGAADERVRTAREEAFRQGELNGRRLGQAEVEGVLVAMASALRELDDLRPRLRAQAEGDVIRLALAIARRILIREVNVDQHAMLDVARAAFQKLRIQEVSRVTIHPDLQLPMQSELTRIGAGHIEILPDPSHSRGTLVFDTARGRLDASVETQFGGIEQAITARLEKAEDAT